MNYSEMFKRTGAATNRRTATRNPYEIIIQLREDDPTASWDRLFPLWRKKCQADDDYDIAVYRYAYANFTHTYDKDNAKPHKARKKKTQIHHQAGT